MMNKSGIHYAIEIFTDKDITDVNRGVVGGVFRFVTDRPGYDGSITPKYGLDEINLQGIAIGNQDVPYNFYEGFLQRKAITKNPSRSIDIVSLGNYSTDTSFSFSLRNNDKFWNFCRLNEIEFTGRTVILWVIIENVFYQFSRGKVVNNPYNETDYIFEIQDDAVLIHKNIPPRFATGTSMPDSPDTQKGDCIPVVFGKMAKSKMLKIEADNEGIKMSGGHEICAASNYFIHANEPIWFLSIITATNWAAPEGSGHKYDSLVGKYISVVAGDTADTDKIYRITSCQDGGSVSHSYYKLFVYLDAPLVTTDDKLLSANTFNNTPVPNNLCLIDGALSWESGVKTWWFQISDYKINAYASNSLVSIDRSKIFTYNSSKDVYENFSSVVDISDSDPDVLKLSTNTSTTKGEIKVYDRIKLTLIEFGLMFGSIKAEHYDWYAALNAVTDKERSTYIQFHYAINDVMAGSLFFDYIPQPIQPSTKNQVLTNNYDKKYFCVDISLSASSYPCNFEIGALSIGLTNIYGHTRFITSPLSKPILKIETPNEPFNFIPNKLMIDGEGIDSTNYLGRKAFGDGGTYRILFTVNDESPSIFASTQATKIRFSVSLKSKTAGVLIKNIRIKDVAIIGEYGVETISGDIFAKVQGETLHNNGIDKTDNVYNVFRRILEDYDGIPSALIDYGDLPTTRINWIIGRTLTKQKNSVEYLSELAAHSFVGIFTGRTGKRMLRTFQNVSAPLPIAMHDDNLIIRNSINKYEKTNISQLYNSFFLQYHYDEGARKFLRSFNVTNIGEGAIFPDESETAVDPVMGAIPKWWLYFGGLPSDTTSYNEAKTIWNMCQNSYLQNKIIRQAQNDASQLNWFIDSLLYDESDLSSTGDSSAAYKFLYLFAKWATLQKYNVSYSIPLNNTTILSELLDVINFKDTIYTNKNNQIGWMTGIELDTENDLLKIQDTLLPSELLRYKKIQDRDDTGALIQDNDNTGTKIQKQDI